MISEKTFIRYYSSFWNQLLPGVDHYVRMINTGYKERFYTPISEEDIPTRRALINSIAFKLFYAFYNKKCESEQIKTSSFDLEIIEDIRRVEVENMRHLDNSDNFDDKVSTIELNIIEKLVKRLLSFSANKNDFEIYPKFQGCGLVFDCYGDIRNGKTLVEIKAGNNNFTKLDLFQLLLYGALNYIGDNKYVLERFHLLNIRTGVEWNEDIETVCEVIAGESSSEIYSEIVNFITNNYRSI